MRFRRQPFIASMKWALLCFVMAGVAGLPGVSRGQEVDVESIVIDPLRSGDGIGQGFWERVADAIVQIERVRLACYEPENRRLLLVGDAAGSSRGLHLEDFALAVENVHAQVAYDARPLGMTIDPDTVDFFGPEMIVRYFGGCERTRSGRVMFSCDRHLKCLSAGRDNRTGEPVSSAVPGFKNMLQLGIELGEPDVGSVFNRFWYVLYAPEISDGDPRYRSVLLRLAGEQGVYFEQVPVFVRTEIMYRRGNELVSSFGRQDPKAEAFAGHFNANFAAFAAETDALREIEQIGDLMSLALWIEEDAVPLDRHGLALYRRTFADTTPLRTPSVRNSLVETRVDTTWEADGYTIHTETVSCEVFGGVEFAPKNFYGKDAKGAGAALLRAAREAEAAAPGEASSWDFRNEDRDWAALSLPDPRRRLRPAAHVKRTDATVKVEGSDILMGLHRFPSPYGYRGGDFGPGFSFGLPRLIMLPTNRTTWIQGDRKKTEIQVFECTLKDELGTIDIPFGEPEVDPATGALRYPCAHPEILGFYPNENEIRLKSGIITLDPVYHVPVEVSDSEGNAVHYEWGVHRERPCLQAIWAHPPHAPPAALSTDRAGPRNVVERVFGSQPGAVLSSTDLPGGGQEIRLLGDRTFRFLATGDCVAIQTPDESVSLDYEPFAEGGHSSRRLEELGISRRGRAPPAGHLFHPVYGPQGAVGDVMVDDARRAQRTVREEGIGEVAVFASEGCRLAMSKTGEIYELSTDGGTTIRFEYAEQGGAGGASRSQQHMVVVDEAGAEPVALLVLPGDGGTVTVLPAYQVAAYRYDENGALIEFRNVATDETERYEYEQPAVEVRKKR